MTRMSEKIEQVASEQSQLSQDPADAMSQLSEVLAAYNEAGRRINEGHRELQEEVALLRCELQQKDEQLQRKSRLAALGEMAAGMAHEIRNPLGAVQLYASLLERDLAAQPNQCQWAYKISHAVGVLDQIITDILAFTHNQKCVKADTNIFSLILEVTDYVASDAAAREIELDLSQIDRELVVSIDVNMMRRILSNLMLNAIEAIDSDGQIKIVATTCVDHSPYTFEVMVSDTGCGIKQSVMNKMFNPFFTTKGAGTGLGLAIVHQLVECQGGVITAANGKDVGAVFTILLP